METPNEEIMSRQRREGGGEKSWQRAESITQRSDAQIKNLGAAFVSRMKVKIHSEEEETRETDDWGMQLS